MKCGEILVLGIFLILSTDVSADYYTSIPSLLDLLEVEVHLIAYFEKYMEAMEAISKEVNDTLKQLESDAEDADENPWEYYENPINAYKIISRFAIDWQNLNKTVFDERPMQVYFHNTTMLTEGGYPEITNDDLVGASKGLARLQRTYRQDTIDVADGALMGWIYSEDFTATECYWLGRSLYGAGEYKYASEWLMQARIRLAKEYKTPNSSWQIVNITDVDVLEFLAPSMFNLGKSNVALLFNEELLAEDPTNTFGLENSYLFSQKALEERHAKSLENFPNAMSKHSDHDQLFDDVCNGNLRQSPSEKRNLRCRYVHNNVPFCFIAPFKQEELSHDPPVAYYHETIYESEIEKILDESEDKMDRSMIGTLANASYSDRRTSQTAWLDFEQHSFLNSFAQRLSDVTGLVLETGEQLQVANYGIGGHFQPHCDFKDYDTENDFYKRGNRLLTALVYISDVELGGATAFPYLRLSVPPVKRSILIWYNLHESLEFDYRTKHGGCPVLVGSKWICTEWFHEAHQEFKRPCGLKQDGHKSLKYKDIQCTK